jgi:hypothetical protein
MYAFCHKIKGVGRVGKRNGANHGWVDEDGAETNELHVVFYHGTKRVKFTKKRNAFPFVF